MSSQNPVISPPQISFYLFFSCFSLSWITLFQRFNGYKEHQISKDPKGPSVNFGQGSVGQMGHCWGKLRTCGTQFLQFFKCPCGGKKEWDDSSSEPDCRNVHPITTIQSWDEKLTEATRDGKIIVANFSTPWSAPCRSIAPIYCKLADKYPSLVFVTVDVDALPEFSTEWDISATPTFFFIKDGRQVDKFVGADKVQLPKMLAAIANEKNET